ncbi:MAG: N-acetylmuramoyl-L-alanine amidase [Pseudomonadota bacterium]
MVVIHYTAMTSAEAALRALCDPEREVSAHYLIARSGEIYALVDEQERAWHAGAGQWGDVSDVNSRSIGIELDNDGVSPFSARLMDALEELLGGIMARWAIRPERVIGHSDLAPGRKIDPGIRFDWQRLARSGFAVWPDGPGAGLREFHAAVKVLGYTAGVEEDVLLDSFRRRFRPWKSGPMDETDAQLAAELAARFPVDQTRMTS